MVRGSKTSSERTKERKCNALHKAQRDNKYKTCEAFVNLKKNENAENIGKFFYW